MESQPKPGRNGPGRCPKAARSPYTVKACQECRRRRAKCDGAKPSCTRCLDRGSECKFTPRDDSRGTAPKSLVLLLQDRIELLEQVLWLHSIDVNASIAQLKAGRTSLHGGAATTSNQATSSTAQQTPQSTEPDGALCLKESFGVEGDGEVSYFGSSSGRVELLQMNSLGTDDTAAMMPTTSIQSRFNRFCQEIASTPGVSDELKVHLIDLYFHWEQPWCQLVDEGLFRQSMQNKGRYFSPLLLNCILAIGSRYSDRPEVRSVRDDPNTAGQAFLEIAEVLLHFDLQYPSITTIQSLGILAMMYVATGSDSKGWLRHGMAVRLALDMGLNLNCSIMDRYRVLSDVESKLRMQIFWSLYCTDKLWASYTGRICTMLESQASVELPLPTVTCPDEYQPNEALLVLLHALSTQCQILEKILMSLYAPKRLPLGIQQQAFFDSCLLQLKSWKYRLPANLQVKSPLASKTQILPQVYILHMVYHTSIIMLAKPFLARRQEPPAQEPSTMAQHEGQAGRIAERAATLCMEAAREICFLGEQYRKSFGSFRHSPVTATHCTLSAVLFFFFSLKHCRQDESEDEEAVSPKAIAKLINSSVVTLGELAHSWMPARQYWRAILAIVKDSQNLQEQGAMRRNGPEFAPSLRSASPAPSEHSVERGGSVWARALDGADAATDPLQHVVGWPNSGDYGFPGFGGESFSNGLLMDLPYDFDYDIFSGNSAGGFEF
ncbi:fungal-specific transcription factor domain-containing protein [Aspergillus californicus]